MDVVKSFYPDEYTLDTEERYPGLLFFVQSNLMRLEYAAECSDLLWVDSDIELFSKPSFSSPGFYSAKWNEIVSLFYVNGETRRFEKTLQHYRRVFKEKPLIRTTWLQKGNLIEDYKHHRFTHPLDT